MRLGLLIAALVLMLDQASKIFIMTNMVNETSVIEYTSFFNLVRAWNTGVSFSMFSNFGLLGVVGLSLLSAFIVGLLLWWLKSEKSRFLQTAIGFIVGGAIGNIIDRLRFGAVFDFLDFHIYDKHWPAFNAADSFICIGAVMVVLSSILAKKEVVK